MFTLEYEMTSSRREVYAPVRNKAVAFVSFQHDSTLAILPVVKVSNNNCNNLVLIKESFVLPVKNQTSSRSKF